MYKCDKCNDSGSLNKFGPYYDCTSCDAAEQRVALEKFRDELREKGEGFDDIAFAIHQRALAMAPKQEALQEPVAYLRFRAAQQWSGIGGHEIEHCEWLETCQAHEVGDDKLPAFPVYAAPAVANGAPELPSAEFTTDMHIDGRGVAAYSSDQMRAYGQACHAMGRGAAVREYVENGTFKQPTTADGALTDEKIMEIVWRFQAGGDDGKFTFLSADLPHMFRAILAAAGPDAALVDKALRVLEGYAENYDMMSRIGKTGDVDCRSVAHDIRRNMVDGVRAALSVARGN